jgi:hypothetical protein
MNRRKHPERPQHRRTNRMTDRVNVGGYRVTATWPGAGQPEIRSTTERAQVKRWTRELAEAGAHVTVTQHTGHGAWRTLREVDGPALVAERQAAERARQEAEAARIAAELRRRAEARRAAITAARDRAQAAALMVQPPVPRGPGQRTARHTAGSR